jgi:hypothetical protein
MGNTENMMGTPKSKMFELHSSHYLHICMHLIWLSLFFVNPICMQKMWKHLDICCAHIYMCLIQLSLFFVNPRWKNAEAYTKQIAEDFSTCSSSRLTNKNCKNKLPTVTCGIQNKMANVA